MNERQPKSLTGEAKIAQILRACDVNVMTNAVRIGWENDWGYETPESMAEHIWKQTEMDFSKEDPLIRPIYAYTEDREFQFHPVIKDAEDRRLLLLQFYISRGEVRFRVQPEAPIQNPGQFLMSLDQVFELAINQ